MKLRINGSSIRLRLLRSDVSTLIEQGRVAHTIRFSADGHSVLRYGLEHRADAKQIELRTAPSEVNVILPTEQAKSWAGTEQVGLYATLDLGGNGSLDVLVEKDFACLDLSDADNTDTFPNPLGGTVC